MRVPVPFAIALALAGSAVSAAHDHSHRHDPDPTFRAGERPSFDRSMDVARLEALLAEREVTLLDGRLEENYSPYDMIPGALRADPEQMHLWLLAVPRSRPVVVYCASDGWVSRKLASRLEERWFRVFRLEGGHQAWRDAHAD
jgi:Rhodanese-related sulfurtransferase